ncbi:MAG: hypothetical protein J5545_03705 [Bacteroidaceae bacterium]|nr:hypothetical protein [Bacteroidaceae bacterium]
MKRNLYFLTLCTLICSTAFIFPACSDDEEVSYPVRKMLPDYQAFVKEGRRWNCQNEGKTISYSYHAEGDTLLQGKTYKKIHWTDSNGTRYFAAVREENMRVFIVDNGEQGERLLYDFCPQIGDVLSYPSGKRIQVFSGSYYCWVSGQKRRMFEYIDISYEYVPTTVFLIYEGIGTACDPFQFRIGDIITCYDGEQCIYQKMKAGPYPVDTFPDGPPEEDLALPEEEE